MAIDDPLIPAAPVLTGPAARSLLSAAVAAAGGRLGQMRLRQVLYRPGRELIVRYHTTVAWGGAAAIGETLLVGATPEGPPPGTLPMETDEMVVGVWRYPFDPYVPGLSTIVHADRLPAVLGLHAEITQLDVLTYRPTRRALVHAQWPGGEAYVKALPPHEARSLVATHERLLDGDVPVARIVAADLDAGIVALEALGPEVLRRRVLDTRGPWPSGSTVLSVLDRLADTDLVTPAHARSQPLVAVGGHARMLAAVLPSEAARIAALRDAMGPPGVVMPVGCSHGDLHDGQLLADENASVTGVLDVDGAGPGDRLDDLANLIGHLASLRVTTPTGQRRLDAYVRDLHASFAPKADRHELDRRIAAVVLALATGPFRVQSRSWRQAIRHRLTLAERWLRPA